MPLVNISTRTLNRLVGRDLPRDELVAALEQLGNDVEGHATVTFYRCGRCGHVTEVLEHEDFNGACAACADRAIEPAGGAEVVRISLLPVRPDLFDAAGLARALRGFLGIETGLARFDVPDSGLCVRVQPGLEAIRPHLVACVARGLTLDDETLKMLMRMQENLHWALGRDRRRASIGVYDLDAVTPDFDYGPVRPDGVRFVPLAGMPEGMEPATPAEILERHSKGVAYRHLLAGLPAFPLLSDAKGRVLSLPPVINSEETRVTARTRNLFVDVTGPDRHAVVCTLAVIATSLADLGAEVASVTIVAPDGAEEKTPDLAPRPVTMDPAAAEKLIGVPVPDVTGVLGRMRYGSAPANGRLRVEVPAYRADIMHERDIVEDVAIGHGFGNIPRRLVPTMTVGSPRPIEELSTTARRVMTGLGFLETMTLALTSEREQFELLGLPVPEHRVRLENPISVEQTMAREQLLSGLLGTFRVNTTREMPQSIFEAGDVFALDETRETGVRTSRRVAAGLTGPEAGFSDARRAAETLARELGVEPEFTADDHPAFIPGRCARILIRRGDEAVAAGRLGEIHPQVLEHFGLAQPVAVFELDLSPALCAGSQS
ncbi:MAG TPA: phenylalanine--tRNA ligase subunit beta [candidate division WOR-3 bacterium]|uniref:Phenylalanine--tRNA ligase beta subunit n=1 Tax=candidate division WOR-3 bacterium TaxID=2052148 RepID=A0A7V0T4T3_UNCW3|nr:phenylalanine--tRNA ligase subunit beta [candidate division WOR-3 bacterium]